MSDGQENDLPDIRWLSTLARMPPKEDGTLGPILPTVANLLVILANDPVFVGADDGRMLAYNAFTAEPLIMRSPPSAGDDEPTTAGPYPRSLSNADITLIHAYAQRRWSWKFTAATVEAAIITEASLRQFHPIREWLDTLVWDGVSRINTWLSAAFGADNTPLNQAIGSKLLIAGVRRVRQPGCKFDEMMILEGDQGIGKSRTICALFGADWFSDAVPPDLSGKEAAQTLMGVWCLEFAEIEHLTKTRTELETIKAFLSRQVDRYRPPYGRFVIRWPRQVVMIGTTNSDDYLRDASGNRRIWPVRCKGADVEWVTTNREQLWAEAALREASGESVWFEDDATQKAAEAAQSDRMSVDPWMHSVLSYLIGKHEVLTTDILFDAIGMPKERMHRGSEMRISGIMRQLGWIQERVQSKGMRSRVWVSRDVPPANEEPGNVEEIPY